MRLILIILLFIVISCNNVFKKKIISEGIIKYEIIYLDDQKKNPIISLLPKELIIKFNEKNAISKVEGWMGIFSMSGITLKVNGTTFMLVKLMDKKYVYEQKPSDQSLGYDELPGMKIEFVEETKEIVGYKCKKAIVSFPNADIEPFDIFYTNDIKIEDPNWNNPFKVIDGVLLEFQMSQRNIKMRLIAKNVAEETIEDNEFAIPDGYEKVSREEMEEFLNSLM